MADMWSELLKGFVDLILDTSNITAIIGSRYYVYEVPNNVSYPYLSSISVEGKPWMTCGNGTNGFKLMYPIWGHSKSGFGGITTVMDLTTKVDTVVNLSPQISMTSFYLNGCRKINHTKPVKDVKDKDVWHQMLLYEVTVQEK